MCGIIAYFGKRQAFPILIDGLKKLEYRGYDSAGICISDNGQLMLTKKKGRVSELEKEFLKEYGICSIDGQCCENKIEFKEVKGSIGIAHTRWATHGEPNETNAHPHFDCKKEIAVAHNGIIENYTALKEILEKEGHVFLSKTDTEVISHLVEKFYLPAEVGNGNLEDAVLKAVKLIEGTYGIAVISKRENKIVVARKGSPVVLGIGEGENIVASDAVAVLPYTKRVIYLNDGEMVILTDNSYTFKNFEGQNIEKVIDEIKWTAGEIEKRGYKHFMLKEIFEQPKAIENTLRGRIDDNLNLKLSIDINFSSLKRIIIVACGTSWHSALIGKYLIEKIAGFPVEVDYASEFRYRDPIIGPNDLLLVISQSGETADALAALREAKSKGAKTLGIINVVGSTIAREVDSGIYLHAGPEIGVATTKAFSCQVTALVLFALYLAQQKGIKIEKDFFDELKFLPEKIGEVLKSSEKIISLAEKFKDNKNFLYLGRGVNFPVALEGALKLKEISYIHAEGYPAAEMKHGPIALVDCNMPVVFIATKDHTYSKVLSNMEEVKARGGEIIALVNEIDSDITKLTENIIMVPKCREELSPIINTIPLQILAYHIANFKGIDVDKPKNLAKSVTVE